MPLNDIKVLDYEHRVKLLNYISLWLKYFNGVYSTWLSASLKDLQKGDLFDPSNWRGIVLPGMCPKLTRIFINTR